MSVECVHEHRARYPVVEGGRKRRVSEELRSRCDIDVRKHPHRARVEDEATSEGEHCNLDEDEESNLHAQSVRGCKSRRERSHLQNDQLLTDSIAYGPSRGLHVANGKQVQVDASAQQDN